MSDGMRHLPCDQAVNRNMHMTLFLDIQEIKMYTDKTDILTLTAMR